MQREGSSDERARLFAPHRDPTLTAVVHDAPASSSGAEVTAGGPGPQIDPVLGRLQRSIVPALEVRLLEATAPALAHAAELAA